MRSISAVWVPYLAIHNTQHAHSDLSEALAAYARRCCSTVALFLCRRSQTLHGHGASVRVRAEVLIIQRGSGSRSLVIKAGCVYIGAYPYPKSIHQEVPLVTPFDVPLMCRCLTYIHHLQNSR